MFVPYIIAFMIGVAIGGVTGALMIACAVDMKEE